MSLGTTRLRLDTHDANSQLMLISSPSWMSLAAATVTAKLSGMNLVYALAAG